MSYYKLQRARRLLLRAVELVNEDGDDVPSSSCEASSNSSQAIAKPQETAQIQIASHYSIGRDQHSSRGSMNAEVRHASPGLHLH